MGHAGEKMIWLVLDEFTQAGMGGAGLKRDGLHVQPSYHMW